MKRIKSMLALLLAALMTLTLLPVTAAAESAARTEEQAGHFAYVNPFYRRTHTDAELAADLAARQAGAQPTRAATPHYTSFASAAGYVRSQMVARKESFTLSVPDTMLSPTNEDLTDALVEEAMAHAAGGDPRAGDSLRWQIGYCYCTKVDRETGKNTLHYTAMYYTTTSQENALTSEVNSALAALKLSGKTEKQKVRAIYDYICDRVNYDYEHVEDSSYLLQYTAYAAMHNRTAVCQGYAVLFYRMCMEAGLDVRVVTSVDHAWNIVRLGSVYYNVDATWDGQDDATTHDWYLKGMRDFPDHYREHPYDQEPFEKAYPMVRDPDLNVANFMTAFPGVDGADVSAKADGKAKLLIFGTIDDGYSMELLRYLAYYDLSRLDVVYADSGANSRNEVSGFTKEVCCAPGVSACWNQDSVCANAMWQALDQCGDRNESVYAPVIVYLDAGNRIQHYTVGPITHYTLINGIQTYLGVTMNSGAPYIIRQPKAGVRDVGDSFTLYAVGRGAGVIHYQWYSRPSASAPWQAYTGAGATDGHINVKVTAASMDGCQYRCRVYNEYGYTYSDVATLAVYRAPAFTTQPHNITAPVGDTAKFKVEATGVELSYQWQYKTATGTKWNNCTMKGFDGPALYVPVTAARNGYQYRCVIKDVRGAQAISGVGTLKVKTVITSQPANVYAPVGDTAKFTVKATGAGLQYQWQYRTATGTGWLKCSMEGNQTKTLSVPVTAARNGYRYRCKITDANGKVTYTDAATLTVKTVITSQPADWTAPLGNTARFTVKATGYRLTYQWQYKTADGANWVNSTMAGSDTNSIGVISTAARNGQQYRCVITDGNGNKTYSAAAKLRVGIRITGQPKDVTAAAGETVTFSVTADGLDLTYQWQYKAADSDKWINSGMTGSQTATLTVKATAARNGQQYRCVITGAGGVETVAGPATLTVA